jgi:hypothetical protein
MDHMEIVSQNVYLPSLHLMRWQQINHPELGDAIAIGDPNEQLNP